MKAHLPLWTGRVALSALTALTFLFATASGASAGAGNYQPIVGTWAVKKCFTSGSPVWTTVVGHCFDGHWTFSADGAVTDGGAFVGTWSGNYPDYSATFARRDGFEGSETVTGLTMTSGAAAFGDILSVADCGNCGTAEGTVALSRDGWNCEVTVDEVVKLLEVSGAPADTLGAVWADPCGIRTGIVESGAVTVADDPDGGALIAGGGYAPCKVATQPLLLKTHLFAGYSVETASFDMVTHFCHSGGQVFTRNADGKGGFLPKAAIQNVDIKNFGKSYQVKFEGVEASSAGNNWMPWNGSAKGLAYTTLMTKWSGGLPVVSWAWPENDTKTSTHVVHADGTSKAYFGAYDGTR